MMKVFLASLFMLCLVGSATEALAHGLGWQRSGGAAVSVHFQYGDGENLAYGAVSVFSPAEAEFEYQKGRADRNGFFAFVPDQPGQWKLIAEDGQGHRSEAVIEVTAGELDGAAPAPAASGGAQKPGPEKIILGLSVFLNLALIGLLARGRKKSTRT